MKIGIVGGGIGGLTTALCLQAKGIEAIVFEKADAIGELGVGLSLQAHAVKVLQELGLSEELEEIGVAPLETIYPNRQGQEIWRDVKPEAAEGAPREIALHRGKLQALLLNTLIKRHGEDCLQTGHTPTSFEDQGALVDLTFSVTGTEGEEARSDKYQVDALVGAEGIHSVVRKALFPNEGEPLWNGQMIWRGAVEADPFLSGRSILVAGGVKSRFICYPIYKDIEARGKLLMNWVMLAKVGDGAKSPARREDWSRLGQRNELMSHVVGAFELEAVNPITLINTTLDFYEYPMCDRDPLDQWSFGRVTLLGDAAHPMYPVGSNGASQAVLDASSLAQYL